MHEPPLLFLDEPTAALDPEAAHLVREFVEELRKEGRTIFLCTHNLDEADRLCDRIGVFKARLIVVDTPANLRSQLFERKVVYHLKFAANGITETIGNLPFVKDCKRIDNKLVVALNDPEVHNPEIIRLLVGMGADVQFVGDLKHSLEDVYLQLVEKA